MRYVFNPETGVVVYRDNEEVARFEWVLNKGVTVYCANREHRDDNFYKGTKEAYESPEYDILDIQIMGYDHYWYQNPDVEHWQREERFAYFDEHTRDLMRLQFNGGELKYGERQETQNVVFTNDGDMETINWVVTYKTIHDYPHGITVSELIKRLSELDGNTVVSISTTADCGYIGCGGPVHDIVVCNGCIYLHSEEDYDGYDDDDYYEEEDDEHDA